MGSVRVGLFPPVGQLGGGPEQLHAALARVAEAGVDYVCIGDHVSVFVGAGSDGLITATARPSTSPSFSVHTSRPVAPRST
jgi:alkanesulfonate monooxygenase SsuD/methylene tetrahydromethanopterin reductase-like flavin-dependent oxidoreductase (luciferase family)